MPQRQPCSLWLGHGSKFSAPNPRERKRRPPRPEVTGSDRPEGGEGGRIAPHCGPQMLSAALAQEARSRLGESQGWGGGWRERKFKEERLGGIACPHPPTAAWKEEDWGGWRRRARTGSLAGTAENILIHH